MVCEFLLMAWAFQVGVSSVASKDCRGQVKVMCEYLGEIVEGAAEAS